jgi:hypothetical protein
MLLAAAALAGPGAALGASVAVGAPTPTAATTLNLRDFGAIGDGTVHRVREWITRGEFATLRGIQQRYPFVDSLDWSVDEVAFARAKLALPPAGGTIHFPVGHYVTGKYPWRIWRDHVRLTGDGPDRTILSTAPNVAEGLSVSPYRHTGWMEGAAREYPYAAASGAKGEDGVRLSSAAWTQDFHRGDLVFIRNGANRFDQDYGEFNEVAGVGPAGELRFKHPLSRDYTLARFNWAAETAADFALPGRGNPVRVTLRIPSSGFVPPEHATVSIGENVFCVEKVYPSGDAGTVTVRLGDLGRANAPKGTVIPAGARVGKARTVLRLTRSTRDFRCENLQIVGHRKAVNLSNSYDTAFADCTFIRDVQSGGFKGGLTIDGDGGRFARFDRCRIVALPAAGMQFARSFGGVVFSGCTFTDANVAFTEFSFACEVSRCTFHVQGSAELTSVIVAGKSCGDLRIVDNEIHASGVKSVFDGLTDIQSQKHGSDGDVVVRGNTIETDARTRVFAVPQSVRLAAGENSVTSR